MLKAILETLQRRDFMSLTTKELMLVQDNIKMAENSIKFLYTCADMATDAQVKGLCQSMAKEHQQDLTTLIKHINTTAVQ
jgi:rubrerythrin